MRQQKTVLVPTRLGPLHVHASGSGPTAVLWHSLFADSTTWTRIAQPLASSRRLLCIDGPGHGSNPRTARQFTLDDCAGVALDVLAHFSVDEPADWLGNAWGGHVGIVFAAEHPDRCRSLATIGAPVHALTADERRRVLLLATLYRLTGARPVTKPLVEALAGPRARTEDPEGAAIIADAFRRAGRRGMLTAIRSVSLARPDLTAVLDRIETPSLLATAADDPMWQVASAQAAAAHLRHGTVAVLPGAGHIGPLLQAAPVVTELVTEFWRDPHTVPAVRC